MSEHDDDIDFDFFGDSTPEPPKKRLVRRPSGPRTGGGSPPPKRPPGPPHTASPIVRLASLIGFAIAIILILIFAIRSCESSNESAAYKSYMDNVSKIASDSQSVGGKLSNLLDRQDLKEASVESTLKGLISEQETDIKNASTLTPPGPLRQEHEQMVEALQLRSAALNGLLNVFRKTAYKKAKNDTANKAGRALSKQMMQGVASDVLWENRFAASARDVLKRRGISGVSPPSSVFVSDTARASYNSMGVVWQSFHGVPNSGNASGTVHGTNIDYVKVLPGNVTLAEGVTKTIKMDSNLRFVVGVRNGGDYTEQNITVTLRIKQRPDPITKVLKIDQIYSGTVKEVVFQKPWSVNDLINQIPITIDVTPVTGETNKTNNTVNYEVRFTF
jgi:hypothetical protein